MQVQVHYQGLESSPWLDQFITRRVEKLERFLSPHSDVVIHLRLEGVLYHTTLEVQNTKRRLAYTTNAETLYEAFSETVDKAQRDLGERKRKLKDRINRNFFSLKKGLAV